MTIATNNNRMDYTGNGVTTVYPYTFKIYDAAHLVITKIVGGIESVLTLNVDYTVSGVGSPSGGNITLTAPMANGVVFVILRVVPLTQLTDIKNQSSFFPEVHEDVFDKLTMMVQQHDEEIGRSVKVSVTSTQTPDQIMADVNAAAAAAVSAAAAAAVSAAAAAVAADVITSLYEFGAVGDGVTDDTAAVVAAFTYAATNGVCLHPGSGEFLCSSKITIVAGTNFSVIGDGVGVTRFTFSDPASCGFDILLPFSRNDDYGSNGISHFSNFSIFKKATGGATGTALKIFQSEGVGGGSRVELQISNIDISHHTSSVASNSWFNGIHVGRPTVLSVDGGGLLAHLTNIFITGRANDADLAGSGIIFDTATGSRLSNAHMYWMNKAVEVVGYTEGPTLVNVASVACNYGVYADTTSIQPGLDIVACHMNNFKGNVYLRNRNSFFITECLVYQREESLDTPFTDFYVDTGCTYGVIANNIFAASSESTTPTNTTTGISVNSGQGYNISNNVVRNRDTGIYIGAGVTYVTVHGNDVSGLTNGIVNDTGAWTGVHIANRKSIDSSYIIAGARATMLIPSGVNTDLGGDIFAINTAYALNDQIATGGSWFLCTTAGTSGGTAPTWDYTPGNTTVSGTAVFTCKGTALFGSEDLTNTGGGNLSGSTGRLVVIAGTNRVVIKANITFPLNAVGRRTLRLKKNGLYGNGLPAITHEASSTSDTAMNFVSAPIDVVSGDYFSLEVRQDSGGDLVLANTQFNWFSMEVVA